MSTVEQLGTGRCLIRIDRVFAAAGAFGCFLVHIGPSSPAQAQMPLSCFAEGQVSRPIVWHDSRSSEAPDGRTGGYPGITFPYPGGDIPLVVRVVADPPGDARMRRTDIGNDGLVQPGLHDFPDAVGHQIGTWAPTEPTLDLFQGEYVPPGEGVFFRFDLVLEGFFNPPGPLGFIADIPDPFVFGDHPVFGFIELDMDNNINTGGELLYPQYRYLGNIARYGGLPIVRPAFVQRAATSWDDFNVNFGPVHRSGEEFHLALFGSLITQIDFLAGNNDEIFEPGEAWLLTGEFFHRAHGYEDFSLAFGGADFGVYVPTSWMLFAHNLVLDRTFVSVVFPLTNEGAAQMDPDAVETEPLNGNPSDQASILEALDDLQFSASWFNIHPTGREEQAIIDEWMNQNPYDYLDPMMWDITVALSTTYSIPELNAPFVWTDMLPDARRANFNGDAQTDCADYEELLNFVFLNDATAGGCDDIDDAAVAICEFAWDFSIYDVNYDGIVVAEDFNTGVRPGDLDLDGDVDLADFITFSGCFGLVVGQVSGSCPPCDLRRSDLNRDGEINLADFVIFAGNFTG